MEGEIPLKKLIPLVIAGHILAGGVLCLTGSFSPELPPKPPTLLVKTVKLTPKKSAPQKIIAEAPPPPPQPKKEKKVEEKPKDTPKEKPKSIPKNIPKTPPKEPPKKPSANDKKKQELLAKAKESLNKPTDKKEELKVPEIALPQEEGLSTEQRSYRDELVGRLKLLLKLPEYGLVKLRLTIGSGGEVAKVEILSATSQKNRKHIESTLPTLTFPAPGKNGDKSGKISFLLTLSSD
ncbi:MAG: hypothetical protein KDK62_04655 [Chlamydiia bacterium]|nr:hypothetical protein [Chlamydiia bacterium]